MNKVKSNNFPNGVKIISAIGIILSIILIFVGSFLIINSFSKIGVAFKGFPIGIMLLLPSIIALIFSIFMLKKKNWARIALGIFALMGGTFMLGSIQFILLMPLIILAGDNQEFINFFHSIDSMTGNIIFVLMVFVFWYLVFNKKVKEAFNK